MGKYDYLIVGAGLFGAVCARELTDAGKKCLVIEKREHIAGNCYTKETAGIQVHEYGPHIFHTNDLGVWDYVRKFAEFNHFVYSPLANYNGKLYNLPFNMHTFYTLWDTITPEEAQKKLMQECLTASERTANLEEQAIALVGKEIYEKLIQGYTEKQWGKPCCELPASIIQRLPVRFTYDNNYYNHTYQGIPEDGYTRLVERLLEGVEIWCNTDYLKDKERLRGLGENTIYTGQIDAYFDYSLGALEWRSLRFETKTLAIPNFQGVAGMNFTDSQTPYTRIIEHKHFVFGTQENTVITFEYPMAWEKGAEPYYPINDEKNQTLYEEYRRLAERETKVIFGGRLGEYRYYDMDQVIRAALTTVERLKHEN